MADLRDIELRNAALQHVRELQRRYDDLVPVRALGEGFQFRGIGQLEPMMRATEAELVAA